MGKLGILIDNSKNKPVCIHKLMDFNQAFHSYDSIEGANCQTTFREKLTQKEAAIQAVKRIGLNQNKRIEKEMFENFPQYWDMFYKRLELLKNIDKNR